MKPIKLLSLTVIFLSMITACSGSTASLESIEVTAGQNTKLSYVEGESFDETGVSVLAYYSDETSKNVNNFTFLPEGPLTVSDTQITFYYTENEITKSDVLAITVDAISNKVLTSIAVSGDVRTEYSVGDLFDPSGVVITATYDDASSKEVTNYTYNPTGTLTVDNTAVVFSYTEGSVTKTTSLSITVVGGQTGPTHLGNKTIEEVRTLCETYVTETNVADIGVDMTRTVTITSLAIERFSLVKTKSAFGLDVSAPGKVIMADSTGYIACASSTGQGSLFYKVDDHAGESTSKYTVTGYLSIYLGQPEIYVPGNTYTFNSSLNVNYDPFTVAEDEIDINEFYSLARDNNYNCAGHGYEGIYTVTGVKCLEKSGDVYLFTDGEKVMKVVRDRVSFSIGSTYDIVGMISLQNYSPALRALKVRISSEVVGDVDASKSVSTTITDFKKKQANQEDTFDRFDSFIMDYGNIYKSTVYVSYYSVAGKYYVTLADTDYSSDTTLISSRITAQNEKGMVDIENSSCWNVTWEQLEQYCVLTDYADYPIAVELYFTSWQLDYLASKPAWKVYVIESLIPPVEA
ncbi:MAG: hypothetical protein PHI75_02385 [Bacilli bacterium]|nr:hypothetical protein [Bacilli bacterium]